MQTLQLRLHSVIAKPDPAPVLSNPPTGRQRAALNIAVPVIRAIAPRLIGRGIRPETIDAALLQRR